MADIYADEGITGTKVAVRQGFQRMIRDCMDGQIDIILTKSVSRFSRNTVDTIQYVRMLKEKGIAVIFEKEGINTMTEQGEMFITLMSTLAQNEVESLSQNVKMGIRMKQKRGEMMALMAVLDMIIIRRTRVLPSMRKKRRQLDLFLNCICRDMERIP